MVSTRKSAKRWVQKNRKHVEAYNLKWRHSHKEQIKKYTKTYLYAPKHRLAHKKACISWNRRHPEAIRRAQKRYRMRKRLAKNK